MGLRPFFKFLFLPFLVFSSACLFAGDIWDSPAFSADPQALRAAAAEIKPAKDTEATIFLAEHRLTLDASGKMVKVHHTIYRVDTQEGVEGWAETRGEWEPWYQARPEIKARVITSDGQVHTLDPKTLNDVPTHDNTPDVYTDERAYGGPLPAIAPGAIVEEEITIRDTGIFFSGGTYERYVLAQPALVNRTKFVLSHPESLPVSYRMGLLPDAVVNKSTASGVEVISIENGPIAPYMEKTPNVPSDVVLRPQIEFATAQSWQQVATAYTHQVNDKLRLADVQPFLSRLELKGLSNQDAIRKIVAALHKTVRYTGIEFGESSLVPQFPAETLKRKYGDCKDKAALLVTMLRAAGIPANLALLSSGPGLDTNPELPGMGAFDHAIVYVPATSSSPELWIDATAQYARAGDLPEMDYGRWALIADEKTTALKRVPELTSDKNIYVETREFKLAEYGPALISEKNEQFGTAEAGLREYYDGDSKELRKKSEDYVKDAYLAESLTAMDKGDAFNMDKPFTVTLIAKGKRGFTTIDTSSVYIPTRDLFDGLPNYFLTAEKKSHTESQDDRPKPRTADWTFYPFRREWHYRILAPAGFKIRALPPDKEEKLGTGVFAQKYSMNPDGSVVEAVLQFDSGKSRLTVEEAKTLRDAIVKTREGEGIFINFDLVAHSLLSSGKMKEALAAYRQLVAVHPKEALHHIQLANALLAAGLAEKARVAAKEATTLDPTSALAFSTLGIIMEHDLIGRRFKKGFDYGAALTAYRKAIQLDTKDDDIRANLAYLLEFDSDGERYSEKARLEEAVAEYRELKKLNEEQAGKYDGYITYDLWYAHKFKELKEILAALPGTDIRRGFLLGCIAAIDGPDAAIKKSMEITNDDKARAQALSNAGHMLMRIRKYSQASALLAESAKGQSGNNVSSLVSTLRKTRPYEELKMDESDPASVMPRLIVAAFSSKADMKSTTSLLSKQLLKSSGSDDENEFKKIPYVVRAVAERAGQPPAVIMDMMLAAHYTKEGDDNLGYKVTMESPGHRQDFFVVREDGYYKLLEVSSPEKNLPENIGWEVLERLAQHDLVGARRWLDWVREEIHMTGGDDPLAGQVFPHFWTKGQEGDEAAICAAALALLPSKYLKPEDLSALIQARNNAKTAADRNYLNVALAKAYSSQYLFAELQTVAEELADTFPDSIIAARFANDAYRGLKKFGEWEKLLQSRLQNHPDDADYMRMQAEYEFFRGQPPKSRELLKKLMDRGKASEDDLNAYAWQILAIHGTVDQDAIEAAERADELSKHNKFSVMHTLACLYAQAGKAAEARELLLRAMTAATMEEPNPEVWFGLGLIAEQYGELDAARAIYGRVTKPKWNYPESSYDLAQQHLAALQTPGVKAAKTGGQ